MKDATGCAALTGTLHFLPHHLVHYSPACVQVDYQGTLLDFEKPFRRATMNDLVKEATGKGDRRRGAGR